MNQIKNQYVLFDGGMGREIKKRLPSFDPVLWSASGLIDNPELVESVHQSFIDAGSTVITTNNYTVVPHVLKQRDSLHLFESLVISAGQCAYNARIRSKKPQVLIAGCLPPLHTTYRPDLVDQDALQSEATYQDIIKWLDPFVDFYLAESLSSIQELNLFLSISKTLHKPLYVSLILSDNDPHLILDKTPIKKIASLIDYSSIKGLLFNCCHPLSITEGLSQLDSFKKPFGGYGNTFTKLDTDFNIGHLRDVDEEITDKVYADIVKQWISMGATLIGGCCGVGPHYIKLLSKLL